MLSSIRETAQERWTGQVHGNLRVSPLAEGSAQGPLQMGDRRVSAWSVDDVGGISERRLVTIKSYVSVPEVARRTDRVLSTEMRLLQTGYATR